MDNNFNQNGQFGGWAYTPNGAYNENFYKLAEKEYQKQQLKRIGSRCGLAVILYVAISYGLSFLIVFTSWVFPSISRVYDDVTASLAFDIILTVLSIGIPFLVVHRSLKKEKLIEELPFGTTYNGEAAKYLVMTFLPIMVFSAVGINYLSAFFQDLVGIEFESTVSDMKMSGVGGTLLGTLAIAVVPAIIEETAIRGIVMQSLRKYGDIFAIIASSLLFACMHGNMVQIPYTIIGGILLGYLSIATGSLWPSIVLHFINNFYSVIIMSVNDNFSENASVVVTLIMFIAFIVSGIIGAMNLKKIKYEVKLQKDKTELTVLEKVSAFVVNGQMIVGIVLLGIITLSNINF